MLPWLDIADKVAAAITSVTAVGDGVDVVELTAITAGTDGIETLAMTDAAYYSHADDGTTTSNVPALTLAGGTNKVAGGDIISNAMTLREAKPIIGFVDVSGDLSNVNGKKVYEFTVASSDSDKDVTLSELIFYATGSTAGTLENAKLYDSSNDLVVEANETADGDTIETDGVMTFTGLTEEISIETTYYIKTDIAGTSADEDLSISFYDDNTAVEWSDGYATEINAALLDVPTDSSTLSK